jgi:hypothetical protein
MLVLPERHSAGRIVAANVEAVWEAGHPQRRRAGYYLRRVA